LGIRYAGKQVASREEVIWRVRVWDAEGAVGLGQVFGVSAT
jgi:hypothetical protein